MSKSYCNGQQNGFLLIVLAVYISKPSKAPRFDLDTALILQCSNFENNTVYPMQHHISYVIIDKQLQQGVPGRADDELLDHGAF